MTKPLNVPTCFGSDAFAQDDVKERQTALPRILL